MPRAARADSEYLAGTFCGGSRISVSERSDDEHSPSALRHSEVAAVENPPRHAVPDVGQRSKQDSEVPTAVRGEQSGYVLEKNPAGSNSVNDSDGVEEQAASLAVESGASSGDADVLAGEAATDQIATKAHGPDPLCCPFRFAFRGGLVPNCDLSWSDVLNPKASHVLVDGDAGEPGPEDGPPVGV
jgi:hypothetical protein